ncbi:MAG: pilus assembly protein PilP [Proteobacteria bacterium]|nr:pilus assembly protein PilP [Pseudomonadota bacterium]
MKLIYIAFVCAWLAGCGGEEFQDLRDFVKNSGADMRGKIPPPPEVKLYEPFAYINDMNLTDPFKPRKPEVSSAGRRGENEPDMNRPKEALEEFPLESLKMVGYVLKAKVGHAVIRAPDKKLYQVKVGNYVGMNFGLIQKLSGTEITIKEVVQDSTGDWSERISSLQLVDKE